MITTTPVLLTPPQERFVDSMVENILGELKGRHEDYRQICGKVSSRIWQDLLGELDPTRVTDQLVQKLHVYFVKEPIKRVILREAETTTRRYLSLAVFQRLQTIYEFELISDYQTSANQKRNA